jgi:uncharacterized protein YndB with AHSA1/START domain
MLDGTEHESRGEFLEVTKPRRLAMTWRWLGSEGESRVEIDLKPIDDGTELTFTHALLRDEPTRAAHEKGWTGALDKLEKYLHLLQDTTHE